MRAHEHPPRIGARLREARREQRLSLTEVAARSEVGKGYLSEVERDLRAPSVGTLLRICAALQMPLARLFDGGTGRLVRAVERVLISFGGEELEEFQLTPAGERRLLVLQSEILPGGGSGDEPYRLAADVEFLHVLEGTLDVEVAGEQQRLAQGDSLTFEAGDEHRWSNPSRTTVARVLWVIVPAIT